MLKYIGRRLLAVIPQLVLVTLVAFLLVALAPGDAGSVLAGEGASAADVARVRAAYGLSDPIWTRYWHFVEHAFQGNLGSSLYNSQKVTTIIGNRLTVSLSLVLVAMAMAMLIGIPAGVLAAVGRKRADRATSVLAGFCLAVPTFVSSVFLIKWFALSRNWLPAGGYVGLNAGVSQWLRHLVLPGFALALFPAAELARQVRTAVADTLSRDYVEVARAKGLRPGKVLVKHVLKNSAIPVVTILGLQVGRLLGGTVIVESIFNLPGLGSLVVGSVLNHDIPTVQGVVLFTAVGVIAINLFIDVSYGYFNPKLRTS
jgi:peptide/nickel transport system permease protein